MGTNACILLVILNVLLCGLPTAFAGGASCLAAPIVYGPKCRSSTSIIGHPSKKIKYSISVFGNTQLCCEALSCRRRCSLRSIGCGTGNWDSGVLPWGNNIATPIMRCRGVPLGSGYSFKH